MKIMKFGGSSVESPERIKLVVEMVAAKCAEGEKIVLVISAFGGVTNSLIQLGNLAAGGDKTYVDTFEMLKLRHLKACEALLSDEHLAQARDFVESRFHELQELLHGVYLVRELTLRTLDYISSFGERLSAYVVTRALICAGVKAEYVDARNLVITDDCFGGGHVDFEVTNSNIVNHFAGVDTLQVVTGFIAATPGGLTVTLGRDGSDYTAAIFGAALKVVEIEIWTDVDGIMTCDPRKVSTAFPVAQVTYEEAMELSHFGAKVIYPPTIRPAMAVDIPIRIKNTLNPTFPGTIIDSKMSANEYVVKGITSIDKISLLRLQGSGLMESNTKFYERLFKALSREKINIVMISQASSERSICIAVAPLSVAPARRLLKEEFEMEVRLGVLEPIIVEEDFSIVAIVGSDMKNKVGVSAKFFNSLAEAGVSAVAIAQGSSELNISVVIDGVNEGKALNAVHNTFFFKD